MVTAMVALQAAAELAATGAEAATAGGAVAAAKSEAPAAGELAATAGAAAGAEAGTATGGGAPAAAELAAAGAQPPPAAAAATERSSVRHHLDLGCGIGSVLLMVSWGLPEVQSLGVEAQEVSVGMARRSIKYNGAADRIKVGGYAVARGPGWGYATIVSVISTALPLNFSSSTH